MSNIVLRNLNSSKAEECLSEAFNADEVFGGDSFSLVPSFNWTTINYDIKSLTVVNSPTIVGGVGPGAALNVNASGSIG